MSASHGYEVKFNWIEKRSGLLHVDGKPFIKVEPPPQFGGGVDNWSPEDLLLASLASCLLSTFFTFAEKRALKVLAYDGIAAGELKKGPKGYSWENLRVDVKLQVDPKDEEMACDLLLKAKENCIIASSLNSPVGIKINVNGFPAEELFTQMKTASL